MKVKLQDVAKKLALWHTPTFSPILSHDDLEPILCSVGFISFPACTPHPSTSPKPPSSPLDTPPETPSETPSATPSEAPSATPSEAPSATPSVTSWETTLLTPAANVQWKEYAFPSSAAIAAAHSGRFPPRPRLPFPMIHGLHIIAYKAFLCALECYIDPAHVYNLFHVRAMPLSHQQDDDFERSYHPMKDSGMGDDAGMFLCRKGSIYQCMLEQIAAMEHRNEVSNDSYGNDVIINNKLNHHHHPPHHPHHQMIIMIPCEPVYT